MSPTYLSLSNDSPSIPLRPAACLITAPNSKVSHFPRRSHTSVLEQKYDVQEWVVENRQLYLESRQKNNGDCYFNRIFACCCPFSFSIVYIGPPLFTTNGGQPTQQISGDAILPSRDQSCSWKTVTPHRNGGGGGSIQQNTKKIC